MKLLTLSSMTILLIGASLLNAETVNIKLPEVPEVPKVEAVVPTVNVISNSSSKTNAQIIEEATRKKVVIFSDHVAPEMMETKDTPQKVIEAGDIENGRVAAYLHAPFMSEEDVVKTLQGAGFTILAKHKVDKKGKAVSIVFTNAELQKVSSKNLRGFAGALRITVDKKNNLLNISNPIYMQRAFMQDEYDSATAEKTLATLRSSFKDLKNSKELIKFRVLERFQFMEGMPRYADMQIIKKAPNATLLASAQKSKKVVYEHKLENGAVVLGVKLGKRTSKFIKKTGYQNAGLLPYPVLIENGEAKILDPKYYIAVMYPMLKMSQFMKIATVPGAISKDVDKIFR
ncbi:MAG: hypothetical protein U9Q40_09430 [Campylobacterota bacterium]|nr:hypothetical protein [Campylobacterota bacterium]